MNGKNPRRRGLTMVELVVSVAIMAIMSGIVMALFVKVLRDERSNITRIRMAYDAADLHRELRRFAAVGGVNNTVVDPTNVSVEFTNNDVDPPVRSRLEYSDADGDPATIADNEIRLVPDVDADTSRFINVVRYASPLEDPDDADEFLPIFSRGGEFNEVLLVNFRIGDRRGDLTSRPARANDAEARAEDGRTGAGFQSILFRGAYAPRNRN